MGSYFQMGHDSENLIGLDGLQDFSGVILSPINREPFEIEGDINKYRKLAAGSMDLVLDSQLYSPRSNRGSLPKHPYFPNDLDSSSELSSLTWWESVARSLAQYVSTLDIDAVTSPVIVPKTWTDDYYLLCAETAKGLKSELSGLAKTLLTLIVNVNQMGGPNEALRISSIASEADPDGYYLVLNCDTTPRREIIGEDELAGVMYLIHLLESTGRPVTVSHCSSDLILYKSGGATNCATGKFFNLRRFSMSRYEEPKGSRGKVIAYWFEQGLLAFLRSADVARLEKRGLGRLIAVGNSNNIWSDKIRKQWEGKPDQAWVGLGWRQYLCWFSKTEKDLDGYHAVNVTDDLLESTEQNWAAVRAEKGLFMDEPENDGSWVRNWRQALAEFQHRLLG